MDFRKAYNSILSLYLSLAYTSFWHLESMAPPIGAHEIDGLPEASMAKLIVTKQDPNSLIGSGKSPTNLEAMSLNF